MDCKCSDIMLKFLADYIDWDCIQAVGFDLDGTLYDEFDFVSQVYREIAEILASATSTSPDKIYAKILNRWLEKGSSYNKIFDEVLGQEHISSVNRSVVIDQCLAAYRNFKPCLTLSPRVSQIVEWVNAKYLVFLVTDGGATLQKHKIESLNLYKWISPENISISGTFDAHISKPNVLMTEKVKLLQSCQINPAKVVYFGDRNIDESFARNCGFKFVRVNVMRPAYSSQPF